PDDPRVLSRACDPVGAPAPDTPVVRGRSTAEVRRLDDDRARRLTSRTRAHVGSARSAERHDSGSARPFRSLSPQALAAAPAKQIAKTVKTSPAPPTPSAHGVNSGAAIDATRPTAAAAPAPVARTAVG